MTRFAEFVYSNSIIMKTSPIKGIKGMHDIVEPESFAWRHVEALLAKQFEAFGFSKIATPIVEYTQLFTRSVGDATDIVQKEMYTFNDRNNESLTLRPEGTAPVVRAVVEHNLLNTDPVQKLYYTGPMFRYERPQKGRYRQFHQYGIEVFGVADPRMDAEIIFMLVDLYRKLGLKNLTVKLSSIGCDKCRPAYFDLLVKELSKRKSELSPESQNRLEKNPLRIFDSKNPADQEIIKSAPKILDHLCEECTKHHSNVKTDLKALEVPFNEDRNLVRGLDYYNRTVFEIVADDLGAQNAVGGGGRYDKLVEELGGPSVPAVGYAGGMERLVLLLGEDLEKYRPALTVFFVSPDGSGKDRAFLLANQLRSEGVNVEMDHTGRSMKSQMKRADRLKAKYVVILGGAEIEKGVALVRDMNSKIQHTVSLDVLVEKVKSLADNRLIIA